MELQIFIAGTIKEMIEQYLEQGFSYHGIVHI
jgi:hypothetical protein